MPVGGFLIRTGTAGGNVPAGLLGLFRSRYAERNVATKWAVVPCAVLTVLLIGSGACAESCELKLENGFVGVWRGQCKEGMPYGKGELTYNGKTLKGFAEDGKNGLIRFSLDKDGRNAGERIVDLRRDRSEPHRQATGRSSEGSDSAGNRDRGKPAEDAEAGAPPLVSGLK